MSVEAELDQNQHFSVAPSAEQLKLVEAKAVLKSCREYVYKATVERDFSAYPILAKLDAFIKDA